jgi:hypothetical protein
MKLIRLTTENRDGIFNVDFNDQIIIPKESKMALQSCSVQADGGKITINADNNEITYTLGSNSFDGGTIRLASETYFRSGVDSLFLDIKDKLNQDTLWTYTKANRRQLGVEWEVSTNNDNKVVIEYKRGDNKEHTSTWRYEDLLVKRTDPGVWTKEPLLAGSADNESVAYQEYFLSRGNGFFRTQINNLITSGGTILENGFIIGLSSKDLASAPLDDFTNDDINYGIHAVYNGPTLEYYTIEDGIFTLSSESGTFNGSGDPTNDYIELMINGGSINYSVYHNVDAGEPTSLIADEPLYEANQKLYPFIIFRGSSTEASCNNVRLTASPYDQVPTGNHDNLSLSPPDPVSSSDSNFLQFQSTTLANYLGFNNSRIPREGVVDASTYSYVADRKFTGKINADNFLIEMMNITLDSYDGFVNQRKNILSVVPQNDSNDLIIYEPNTQNFIDLNNKDEINLRNIKCRFLNTDYTPFNMIGLASITILVS